MLTRKQRLAEMLHNRAKWYLEATWSDLPKFGNAFKSAKEEQNYHWEVIVSIAKEITQIEPLTSERNSAVREVNSESSSPASSNPS